MSNELQKIKDTLVDIFQLQSGETVSITEIIVRTTGVLEARGVISIDYADTAEATGRWMLDPESYRPMLELFIWRNRDTDITEFLTLWKIPDELIPDKSFFLEITNSVSFWIQ